MNKFLFFLLCSVLIRFSIQAQSQDTIPPDFTFNNVDVEQFYNDNGTEFVDFLEPNDSTTIVSIACKWYFPSEYNNFPIAEVTDDIENVPIKVDSIDIVNDSSVSVTRVWTAIDGSGNISKYYYTLQWNELPYQNSINLIEINNVEIFSADPSINDFGEYSVCFDAPVILKVDATQTCKENLRILWYLDGDQIADVKTSLGDSIIHKWEKEGNYNVRIIAEGTGKYKGSVEATILVRVKPPINLLPTSLDPGQLNTTYPPVIFSASGGTEPYSYELTSGSLPKGMSFNTNTATLSGVPTEEGTFNFNITATESGFQSGSCSKSISYSIIIRVPLAVSSAVTDSLEIYPNPVLEVLYLKLPYYNRKFSLVNTLGQIVWTYTNANKKQHMVIPVVHLPRGLYILIVDDGKKGSFARKVLLQ